MTNRFRKTTVSGRTGYTVIELVVVIAVIGSVMFMTLPKFSSLLFSDDIETTKKWISVKASLLKEKAMVDRMDYAMVFDMTDGVIRIEVNTEKDPDAEEEEEDPFPAEEEDEEESEQDSNKFTIPEGVFLSSLLFKNSDSEEDQDKIVFYKKGYSDWVILNLEGDDGEQKISIEIEPFIVIPVITGGYKEF